MGNEPFDPVLAAATLAHAPVPVQVVGADRRTVLVNQAYLDTIGAAPVGLGLVEDADFDRALAGEIVAVPPRWYDPREDGAPSGRRCALALTLVPSGRQVAVIARDVRDAFELDTERRRWTLLERDSEELTVVIASDRRVRYASPSVTRILGWSADDLRRQGMALMHPDDDVRFVPLREAIAGNPGRPRRSELRFRHADGSWRWFACTSVALPDGEVLQGVVAHAHDITELKATADALRRSEQELAATLDSIADAVIATDVAGEIVRMNEIAERMTGWALLDARGRHLDEILTLEAVAQVPREPARIAFPRGTTLVRRDERRVPIEGTAAPIHATDGQLLGTVLVFRDTSEERRADELRARSAELELQNRRITEANRLKNEFVASMSHELRTPLNAILGFAELLRDGKVDAVTPAQKELLADIVASGRHLLSLVNDVLDLAKADAGKLELRPREFAVSDVVGEVVSILRGTASARRMRVTAEVDPSIGTVVLDPDRFRQILYNYLSNALKFAPEGSEVRVRALPEGPDHLRVEVEDAGPGIAPADVGRLFVDFQQLEAGLGRRHAGTGVGLALTRRVVEAQFGSVGVRSTPGQGSVFHAILPRRAVAAEVRITRRTLAPRFDAPKVLVVDDDARDAAALVGALAEAGFHVDLVSNGADALARCRDTAFDAIALDLLLPDMSGLDLLAGLRALGTQQGAALVVISAADRSVVEPHAVAAVLGKPIDPRMVIATLERVWGKG